MEAGHPSALAADAKPAAPIPAASPSNTAKPAKANNSACFVCHVNFQEEELAVAHARIGVGCAQCHGKSRAHTDDESNVIPPEILFPKAKVNAACLKCHAREKLSEVHKTFLAGADVKNKYCTDCHGNHRINHRTRFWDKETGKLLPADPAMNK